MSAHWCVASAARRLRLEAGLRQALQRGQIAGQDFFPSHQCTCSPPPKGPGGKGTAAAPRQKAEQQQSSLCRLLRKKTQALRDCDRHWAERCAIHATVRDGGSGSPGYKARKALAW